MKPRDGKASTTKRTSDTFDLVTLSNGFVLNIGIMMASVWHLAGKVVVRVV
jgi:hypothetical protein